MPILKQYNSSSGQWEVVATGPSGADGEDGRGIVSVVRTSGTGAAGTTDTYTITYTDATTSTFNVYNGADGTGGTGGGGGVSSITGVAPISSSGGTTPAISISQASSTTNGYLSSTDWNTFNNKQPAGSYLTSTDIGTTVQPYDADLTSWAAITPSDKQDTLVSGTNIKTINGSSILGSGNLVISGGGSGTVTSVDMTVPTGLTISGNPITTSGTLAVSFASGYSIPTTSKQTEWDTAYSERAQWNGGATNLVAATGRTSLGGTTIGQNFFTLTNPSAITFPRINADNSISTLSASDFRTAIGAGTGSGTVTSVTGTSPVTSSGGATPAISLASGYGDTQNPYSSKTANFVLAAPNGTAGVPTFRAIVAADIPTLNQNTTGTAGNVSGTVAIANGGTGSTTAAGARANLGATTVGSNFFTLADPSAITFPRVNGDNTVSMLDAATFRSAIGAGTPNIPAVGTKTSSYTLTTADVGKYVQISTGGSITIPNATFSEGDALVLFNNTAGNVTITCSITTAYISGTDTDKNTMTLATRGVANILFISGTVCVVTGNVT